MRTRTAIGISLTIAAALTTYSLKDFFEFYTHNHCYSKNGFITGYESIKSIRKNEKPIDSIANYYENCVGNDETKQALSKILSNKSTSFELFEKTKNPSLEMYALASSIDRFIRYESIAVIGDDITMDALNDVFFRSSKKERIAELLGHKTEDTKQDLPKLSPIGWMLDRLKNIFDQGEIYDHPKEILHTKAIVEFLGFDSLVITEVHSEIEKNIKTLEATKEEINKIPELSTINFLVGRAYEKLHFDQETGRYFVRHEAYINTKPALLLAEGKTIEHPGYYRLTVEKVGDLPYNDQYGYLKEAPIYRVTPSETASKRSALTRQYEQISIEGKNLSAKIIKEITNIQKKNLTPPTTEWSSSDEKCYLDDIQLKGSYFAAILKEKEMPDHMINTRVIDQIKEEVVSIKKTEGYLDRAKIGIRNGIINPEKYIEHDEYQIRSLLDQCLSNKDQ